MEIAQELNIKGCKLTKSGRYCEAITLHAEVLDMLNDGGDDDELSATHRYLGENYNMIGEYALAEFHYQESLRNGENDYHYHLFMGDQAKYRGDEKALEHYKKARDIRIEHCGRKSVEVADIDIIIGDYFNTIDDSDRAIEWLDAASDIIEDPKSAVMARHYNAMGVVLRYMGLEDRSLEFLELAHNNQAKRGSECDIDRASTLENLALTLSCDEINDFDRAVEMLQRALKIYEKHYPKNHHHIAGVYDIWGAILMNEGEVNEALQMFQKALSIQQETLSELHFDLADTYVNIGTAYLQLGDIDSAMEYYTLAEQIEGTVYQMGHCHKTRGCAALIEGRFEDAHRELFRALEIYTNSDDVSPIDVIETKCYIDDLQQKIESATKQEVYMDSDKMVYCTKSDDYGISYTNDMTTIVSVPTQIGRSLIGYKSKGVTGSYIECYDSVKIPIPESVTTISTIAFSHNEGVNRVYLPNVKTVEAFAFVNCLSLREVVFALRAKIDRDAFTGCDNLKQ